jgi:hypothetical protein
MEAGEEMNNLFSLICFLVLMQDLNSKAPPYILEKFKIIGDFELAFTSLDIDNQRKVIQYCDYWKLEIPEAVEKYLEDVKREFCIDLRK